MEDKAIEASLSEVMISSELEPALILTGKMLSATEAGFFRFPRQAVGRLGQEFAARPPRDPLTQALKRDNGVVTVGNELAVRLEPDVALAARDSAVLLFARETSFGQADAQSLAACLPAFVAAHRRIKRFEGLLGENTGFAQLIEANLGACAVLASGRGAVLWMSQSARDVLGDDGRAALEERLRRAPQELARKPSDTKADFALSLPGKRRLFGTLSFVRQGPATSVHYIAVQLNGSDVESSSDEYKLTRTERAIYELVMQGLRNEEIARARFISHETARAHVKAILRKTGASSRVELLARQSRTSRGT